jgi:hypothetical protein
MRRPRPWCHHQASAAASQNCLHTRSAASRHDRGDSAAALRLAAASLSGLPTQPSRRPVLSISVVSCITTAGELPVRATCPCAGLPQIVTPQCGICARITWCRYFSNLCGVFDSTECAGYMGRTALSKSTCSCSLPDGVYAQSRKHDQDRIARSLIAKLPKSRSVPMDAQASASDDWPSEKLCQARQDRIGSPSHQQGPKC